LVDQDQMNVSYVVNEINELQNQVELATGTDPLSSQRDAYLTKVISGLGALPGVNTRETVVAALEA
jgi:hypothetical protein